MINEKLTKQLEDYFENKIITGSDGFSKNINGIDLDTLFQNGFYQGNNLINAPGTETQGYLVVIGHSSAQNYGVQIFTTNPRGNGIIYLRKATVGIWGSWYSITGTVVS